MVWQIFRTGCLNDGQIIKFADQFVADGNVASPTIYVGGQSYGRQYDEIRSSFAGKKTYLISGIDIASKERYQVAYRRGTGGTSRNIDDQTRQANAFFDEFGLEPKDDANGQSPSINTMVIVVGRIQKAIIVLNEPAADAESAKAMELLQAQFSRMTELMASSTEQVHEIRLDLEREANLRLQKIEDEAVRLAEASAERSRQLDERHAVRVAEVEAEKTRIDARNNMIVRRELRTQITREIAERLKQPAVPRGAAALRLLILGLLLASSAFLGWVAFATIGEFSTLLELLKASKEQVTTLPEVWFLLLRAVLAGAGAVGLLLYAVSWLKSVYRADVQQQQGLERYAIDLNRASWAVETIMEAKANNDVEVPQLVIAGVVHGLFEHTGSTRSASDNESALASLLRASTKAKIGPQGAEFEMTGRGANKLANKVEGE